MTVARNLFMLISSKLILKNKYRIRFISKYDAN